MSDADLRGAQIGLMAMVPALLHLRAGIGSGILTYELQRLLARYRVQGDALFDELGGNLVTSRSTSPISTAASPANERTPILSRASIVVERVVAEIA